MPQKGNNNEPLLERALFLFDGALWRPLLGNSLGQIEAALASGSVIEVRQSVAANLKALVDVNTGQTIAVTQATAANLKALVDVNSGQTIAVTQATAANLKALVDINTGQSVGSQLYGFLGSSWQKLQQLWGYTAIWAEVVSNLSAAAGTNTLISTAVATGYVHVLQAASIVDANSTTTGHRIQIPVSPVNLRLLQNAGAAAGNHSFWYGEQALAAGETVVGVLDGCTLNDDIYLILHGYKMKIND